MVLVTVDLIFQQFLELYQKRYSSLNKKRDNILEQLNKIYANNNKKVYLTQKSIRENPLLYTGIKEMIEFVLVAIILIVGALTGICKPKKYSNINDWEETLRLVKLGLSKK